MLNAISINLKRITLVNIIVSMVLSAFSTKTFAQQTNVHVRNYNIYKGDTINRKDIKGRKQGVWMKFYKTDTVFYIGQFVDDKPQGVFYYYDDKGKPESKLVWDKTGTKASATHYFPEGNIKAKGNYVNQKKDSTWIIYHSNDSIATIENYKLGVKNGEAKVFYKNGKLATQQKYLNDKLNGPYREYFSDGKVKIEATYKDNKTDGYYKLYHPTGFVYVEGPYKLNKRHGTWKVHKPDGTIIVTDIYNDGVSKDKAIEKYIEEELAKEQKNAPPPQPTRNVDDQR